MEAGLEQENLQKREQLFPKNALTDWIHAFASAEVHYHVHKGPILGPNLQLDESTPHFLSPRSV
jgi:hypothetical protein